MLCAQCARSRTGVKEDCVAVLKLILILKKRISCWLCSWILYIYAENSERRAGLALDDEGVIHTLFHARGAAFCLLAVAAAV